MNVDDGDQHGLVTLDRAKVRALLDDNCLFETTRPSSKAGVARSVIKKMLEGLPVRRAMAWRFARAFKLPPEDLLPAALALSPDQLRRMRQTLAEVHSVRFADRILSLQVGVDVADVPTAAPRMLWLKSARFVLRFEHGSAARPALPFDPDPVGKWLEPEGKAPSFQIDKPTGPSPRSVGVRVALGPPITDSPRGHLEISAASVRCEIDYEVAEASGRESSLQDARATLFANALAELRKPWQSEFAVEAAR